MEAPLLAASRAAGLAPYGCPRRLHVSRCALLYGCVLHLVLGVGTLAVHGIAADATFDTVGYSWVLWLPNIAYLELIIWMAVIRGPKKLADTLFLSNCIKKVCGTLKFYPTTDAVQRRTWWIFIFMALIVGFTVIMDTQCIVLNSIKEYNKVGLLTYGVMLFDLKDVFVLLLTMQFVFMAMKINCVLRAVNEGLQRLYSEMFPQGEQQKNKEINVTYPKDIISGVHYINVKPKMTALFNYHSAHVRLRLFACAFVSTCDLLRKLGGMSGGLLFQLVTFNILNLLRGVYYIVLLSGSVGAMDLSNTIMFSKAPINGFLYFGKIALLVAPCHELTQQLETTRFLVSHICCETSSCSDALREELNVFFIHLKVNQPVYSALGMFPIGRSLLLTVVAFIVTYLALLVGV